MTSQSANNNVNNQHLNTNNTNQQTVTNTQPGLITQVHKNQQPNSDLSNEQKAALQQSYQKFGKEPMPPHLAACGPQKPWAVGKKTLVLDLDETLVHSSFKPPTKPDIILPVEIEGNICNVFVLIRPGTEIFLQRLAKCYELVIYTASLSKYADPLIDILDSKPQKIIDYRLFREHCTFFQGVFIKDMTLPGRPMTDSIIIDNSPTSYAFHQENALPILSWYDDPKDRCLFELIPLLESLAEVDDVRKYIPKFVTADHKVDFQRASYILSNATPKASPKKKMSSQQVQQKQSNNNVIVANNEISDVDKLDDVDDDGVVEEVSYNNGKKSQPRSQNRNNSIKPPDSKSSMTNVNEIVGKDKDQINSNSNYNDNHNTTQKVQKNNQWTLEDSPQDNQQQQQKSNNKQQNYHQQQQQNDQSYRNFSKQRQDNGLMQQTNNNNINNEQVRIDNLQQLQQVRPITRDNKRMMLQLQDDNTPTNTNSLNSQNIKNALALTQTNKSRKLNNQNFSRQSKLQSLLQTDQQQLKKSFNAPGSQYNPQTMTDASIKLTQPSKTPNAKQGTGHINFPRDNQSLSLQRQQQPINIMNIQGMFNTPKHALQQQQQQQQLLMNQTNQLFKFFPNQNSASANNSQNNSEVNTFRGGNRDLSNKNLVRNSMQLHLNDFKGTHFINKQRRMRRNNEQLNSTQPIIQNSQSDIEINDITPKHLKTPSRVQQQSRQTAGSLINKRRQNSRQKLVLNGINGSFQRLTAANIQLDNSNIIQNSNIVINNIQSPIAFSNNLINNNIPSTTTNANTVSMTGRPVSGKRQQTAFMNNFSSPKANQYIQAQKYGSIAGVSDLTSQFSPYSPLNKNINALMMANMNNTSGMGGFMGSDFAQKRLLRNLNRKSGGANNNS